MCVLAPANSSDLSKEREKVLLLQRQVAETGTRRQLKVRFQMFSTQYSQCLRHCWKHCSREPVVKFAPQGPDDVEKAAVCTTYTDYVVTQNNGFDIFS